MTKKERCVAVATWRPFCVKFVTFPGERGAGRSIDRAESPNAPPSDGALRMRSAVAVCHALLIENHYMWRLLGNGVRFFSVG